jgi:hypothetical protein
VSTAEPPRTWTFRLDRLREALDRWERDEHPDVETRRAVKAYIRDALVTSPMSVGRPDEQGVWYTRVPGTNVAIVYVPDPEAMIVSVALISEAS